MLTHSWAYGVKTGFTDKAGSCLVSAGTFDSKGMIVTVLGAPDPVTRNKAVMQLDELTQQNAALVEEASAASQSMADQARGLNETMAGYTVSGSAQPERRKSPNRPWAGKASAAPKAAAKPAAKSGTKSPKKDK